MFRARSKRGFFGRWGTRRAAPASADGFNYNGMGSAAAAAARASARRRHGGGRGAGGQSRRDLTLADEASSDASSDWSSSEEDEEEDPQDAAAAWRMATPKAAVDGAPILSASDRMELNTLLGQANDLLVSVVGSLPANTAAAANAANTATAASAASAPSVSNLARFTDNLAASLSSSEKEHFEELLRWEMAASRGNAENGDPVTELQGHLDKLDADLAEACRYLDERLKPLLEFHERTQHISSKASKLLLARRVNVATSVLPGARGERDGGFIAVRKRR
eukprot:g2250.t1